MKKGHVWNLHRLYCYLDLLRTFHFMWKLTCDQLYRTLHARKVPKYSLVFANNVGRAWSSFSLMNYLLSFTLELQKYPWVYKHGTDSKVVAWNLCAQFDYVFHTSVGIALVKPLSRRHGLQSRSVVKLVKCATSKTQIQLYVPRRKAQGTRLAVLI